MMKRSLSASSEGIKLAEAALLDSELNHEQMAASLEVTRQPISKFFNGKAVEREIFIKICRKLKLDWKEVVARREEALSLEELVQKVRRKIQPQIERHCGQMRVLDVAQPVSLDNIYTRVNILEKISGRKRLELKELLQEISAENFKNFDRFALAGVREQRVLGSAAVEKYSKLLILGKPGSGKTTFLKHVAMMCIRGNFLPTFVPFFINLKDFAENFGNSASLLASLDRHLASFAREGNDSPVNTILKQGRALILLDGLDEVREADSRIVIREIQKFSDQFSENRIVITCRIAARDSLFDHFTEVEVADFEEEQIRDFSEKWFRDEPKKATKFLKKLKELRPIRELATNPLLLTLLCLVFEDSGSGNFPSNRAELYEDGIDVLLKRWDAVRDIERDQIYKGLSVKRKEDLLSQLAESTFAPGNYFFKQREAEMVITEYIQNLPDASDDPTSLHLDSRGVLRSIEAQHGLIVERANRIYSFSHLTFHEYFMARNIAISCNPSSQEDEQLQKLVNHLTERRWREVFLLTAGMLTNADCLLRLMKHKIDQLVAEDRKIQQFLAKIYEKSKSVAVPYELAAIRVIYFLIDLALTRDLEHNLDLALARTLANDLELYVDLDLALDLDLELALSRSGALTAALDREMVRGLNRALTRAIDRIRSLIRVFDLAPTLDVACALDLDCAFTHTMDRDQARALQCVLQMTLGFGFDLEQAKFLSVELKQKLQTLKEQVPLSMVDSSVQAQWWKENGQTWNQHLRNVMIEYRDVGHDWSFDEEQRLLLQQYYDANKLLVDCLNSDCYVSREVRREIEATLLSPLAETECYRTSYE